MEQEARHHPLALAIERALALGVIVPLCAGAAAAPAPRGFGQSGPDFVVNTVEGATDGFCGLDPGTCSLADAILAANRTVAPATIRFAEEVQGKTIVLDTALNQGPEGLAALPAIGVPLAIDGGTGVTLERNSEADCLRFLNLGDVTLELSNLTFSGGCAEGDGETGDGGALWLAGGTLVANTVSFAGNSAELAGGALYAGGATISMNTVTFLGNTATVGGGLAALVGATADLTGSTLSNNFAAGEGGAVALLAGAGRGGQGDPGSFTLTASTITGNTANLGGGIFNDAALTITLLGSTLESNSVTISGGGIHAAAGDLVIQDSTITGNTVDMGNGGGVAFLGRTLDLTGTSLVDNVAGEGAGGGLSATGATVTLLGGLLEGNTALAGGGMHIAEGSLTIADTTISGNTASSGSGGGLEFLGEDAEILGSRFVGNLAEGAGGAVSLAGNTVTFARNTLQGNTADLGGAVHATARTLTLAHTSLFGNTADLAGGVFLGGAVEASLISEATLVGNTVSTGAAQLVADGLAPGALNVERTVFVLGSRARGLIIGRSCDFGDAAAGPDNVATDPSCGNATVATEDEIGLGEPEGGAGGATIAIPGPGSILVDALADCAGTDQRGLPRGVDADGIAGTDCDIGAIEVQNVPVEAVADAIVTDQDTTVGGDLLENDVDPADEDTGMLTVTSVAGGALGQGIALDGGGRLTVEADGTFLFEPGQAFRGLDSAEFAIVGTDYQVTDGYAVDEAAVAIRVDGLNDPPIARPDRYPVEAGATLTIGASAGLLANDEDVDDEPLAVLTSRGAIAGNGGVLLIDPDGAFSFAAPPVIGEVSFPYAITDGDAMASAEVTFDVVSATSTDLEIAKSDGRRSVSEGQLLGYEITVFNRGPAAVTGARVEDLLPATLQDAAWTCVPAGSASCPAAGAGDIVASVDLPAGDSAQFLLTATVRLPGPDSGVRNVASITAPEGITEIDPDDNTAIDDNLPPRIFHDSFEPPPDS